MISRRSALQLLAGGGLALALPSGCGWWDEPDGTVAGIAAVGEAYLATAPGERDEAVLRAALPPHGADDPEAALAELAPAIAEDFATGRTVVLDGWLLSLTEARVAALAAL